MSSRFKALDTISIAIEKKHSSDHHYWKGLQFPITIQEYGAVTDVAFQQTKPYHFVVSASNRVEIYSSKTNELVKSYTRFSRAAHGASFRSDGKLIVAGSEDGHVRLFDVLGHTALRIFKGHARSVYVSKFLSKTQIYSAGDDKTVRVWDVATEKCLNLLTGHDDYIRCGHSAVNSENLIFTGGYDHTVRMYDTRANASCMTVDHGCPVESVLVYPSGSVLLSAGGNSIKVWDILQGGKHLATVSHHHKAITCMRFNHDCTRLMSGSLDRHVKIYDVSTYGVVHNIDYPASILSMDVSNEDKTIVVGMVDKMLSIRHRKTVNKEEQVKSSKKYLKKTQYLMAGETFVPNAGDLKISHEHKEELRKYDIYFRKFQHSKALDEAIHSRVWDRRPEVTVAVLEELIRRGTIRAALAGRKDKQLSRILQFIYRNIIKVNFATIMMEITDHLLDIYSKCIDELSLENIQLFRRLKNMLDQEAECQFELEKLTGYLQTVVRSNAQKIHSNALKESETS